MTIKKGLKKKLTKKGKIFELELFLKYYLFFFSWSCSQFVYKNMCFHNSENC